VPLDPNFPADRLSIYLEDSQSLAVITEQKNLRLAASLIADLPRRPDVSESRGARHIAARASQTL